MDSVAAFFGGNPFASPVGQRIERATDASLSCEDWALNMEICDLINESEDGPKDAVRALRKRLQQNAGKNYVVVMYTLTVLETCVKNCGRRFHALVCSKDFIMDLVKLIGPKNDPPAAVQEKVLSLIQSWADAFRMQPDLQGVVQVYSDLKTKGIEFPMTDLDTMAPILTPQRTVTQPDSGAIRRTPRPEPVVPVPVPAVERTPPEEVQGPIMLTGSQLSKLQRELEVVQGNISVMSEMLSGLTPGQEHPNDLELLKDLYGTCRAMQDRLVKLLDRVANDEVTAHLLKVNDDLNNLFLRYERYEKNRTAAGTTAGNVGIAGAVASRDEASLIDLNDDTPAKSVTETLQDLGLGGQEPDDKEFDMFAQSRTASYETSKQKTSYVGPDEVTASLGHVVQHRNQEGGLFGNEALQGHKEEDFEDIEAWLKQEAAAKRPTDDVSPAMEQYLQQRAGHQPQQPRKPESDENSLFTL